MKKISQICNAYWRQIIVLVSLAVLCLMFSCCKKKDPIATPPPPTCQTGSVFFAGAYETLSSLPKTTFTIELLHNNCPTENSNTYIIKGFGEAVKSYSADNQPLFTQPTYTLYSTESASLAINELEKITIRVSYSVVAVSSPRLKTTIKYIK